jgi:ubiquinone/menaquinone biosynthesis C-methylase UbiE
MLDHTLRRAADEGVEGIVASQADALAMPYEDASLDAAYLVLVLGEIPDQDGALRELHRVVRPGGRVVVGELCLDPHWVSPKSLQERAERAGFRLDGRSGSPLGYFALLGRD